MVVPRSQTPTSTLDSLRQPFYDLRPIPASLGQTQVGILIQGRLDERLLKLQMDQRFATPGGQGSNQLDRWGKGNREKRL